MNTSNISSKEIKQEKKYLKETIKIINDIIDSNEFSIKTKISEITDMKRYIWKNVGDFDDIEIATKMYDINADVGYTNNNIKKLKKLKKSLLNPYFGRIDFEQDDTVESIYIGINGIEKDLKFYVYDWRTPIASMFYNYGIGNATYEAPMGIIKGKIILKRQYKIHDGILKRCFNSDLNIDDEYLQEILSKSSSSKMTNIVNTIQREQNEIIRNVIDKYLIVQGIAGSGKTSVALHRIAYLLYKEKDLKFNNVLIFSPNDVFSNYISQILPELGEENVLQTTYSDFSKSYLKQFSKIESFTTFIERFYNQSKFNENLYKETKFKLSSQFKFLIDEYLCNYEKNLYFVKGLKVNELEIDVNELNKLFKDRYFNIPIFKRLEFISERICDLANLSYRKYGKTINKKLENNLSVDLKLKDLYNNILVSSKFKTLSNLKREKNKIKNQLNFEDMISFLYLYFELKGYPDDKQIKHIIIDEVQDYTFMQLEILKKVFPKASFTILGDVNQTINPYYKYNNLNQINSIFSNQGKYIELTKTYRSSEEIIKYTNSILGLNNICSVRRKNGVSVIEKEIDNSELVSEVIIDINKMKENGVFRIGIITKNNVEAIKLYEELEHKIKDVSLIERGINNIVILPSYISKGLEFDGVISFNLKGNEYQEKDKFLFYVVCTRAQHSLIVYNGPVLKLERRRIRKNGIIR